METEKIDYKIIKKQEDIVGLEEFTPIKVLKENKLFLTYNCGETFKGKLFCGIGYDQGKLSQSLYLFNKSGVLGVSSEPVKDSKEKSKFEKLLEEARIENIV